MTNGKLEAQESFMNEELGVGTPDASAAQGNDVLASLPPEVRAQMKAMQERVSGAAAFAKDFVKDKPLVAVGAAVVAGFIVGRIANRR